jgi:hypothetical protein
MAWPTRALNIQAFGFIPWTYVHRERRLTEATRSVYDVAFDRVLAPPMNDTGNGAFSGSCNAGHANGTTTEYEEGVDLNQNFLNGGAQAQD